jgi:hypothetical protein
MKMFDKVQRSKSGPANHAVLGEASGGAFARASCCTTGIASFCTLGGRGGGLSSQQKLYEVTIQYESCPHVFRIASLGTAR